MAYLLPREESVLESELRNPNEGIAGGLQDFIVENTPEPVSTSNSVSAPKRCTTMANKQTHLTFRLRNSLSSEQICTTGPNRSNKFLLKSSSLTLGQTWLID